MRIVPPFDEVEDTEASLRLSRIGLSLDEFAFEGRKERFAEGIVVAVPSRAHRWKHACVLAALAEGDRRILRALIGMMNRPLRIPLVGSHVERVEDQLGAKVIGHGPALGSAAECIENN